MNFSSRLLTTPAIPPIFAQNNVQNAAGPMFVVYLIGGLFALLIGIVAFFLMMRYFTLWLQCRFSRAGIGPIDLIMMDLQKVNSSLIVRSKIMAVQARLTEDYPISTKALESHYLSGGNVQRVIQALIAAHRARIPLDWQTAAAIDLAGRDILSAVQTSVYPKVIDCPDLKGNPNATLSGMAGDGIELKCRARVTVRTNLAQLIGGATEETIVARVGQGIVQAIGKTHSYKLVLENPELISREVLDLGLEKQTAFQIVSIDIADIDVGDNIGARLQADQAEADMRVAQANAEQRRAEALAAEQEMVAAVQQNRAQVVLAEAQIPHAIAASFNSGKLGLLDYYELVNVQADTRMRQAIAGDGGASSGPSRGG
jgi:uncharacterized protein YqfA (UPF0365 family)